MILTCDIQCLSCLVSLTQYNTDKKNGFVLLYVTNGEEITYLFLAQTPELKVVILQRLTTAIDDFQTRETSREVGAGAGKLLLPGHDAVMKHSTSSLESTRSSSSGLQVAADAPLPPPP